MLSRRQWLAAAGGLALTGLAADAFAVEPRRVSITRHRLASRGGQGPPLRLVQLTDLHLRAIGAHEERIAGAVETLRPGALLLTGDSIDEAANLPLLDSFLALLPPSVPKFAILGNWEHWAGVDLPRLESTYARHGCRLLRNESAELVVHDRRVLLIGLDDLVGGTPDFPEAVRIARPSPNRMLLMHCPAYRETLVDDPMYRPQYMLSGHTHGGQVSLFGWAPLRPSGSGRYVSGWYEGRTPLYVSRGLGTSILPARLGSSPEIACFDWILAPG